MLSGYWDRGQHPPAPLCSPSAVSIPALASLQAGPTPSASASGQSQSSFCLLLPGGLQQRCHGFLSLAISCSTDPAAAATAPAASRLEDGRLHRLIQIIPRYRVKPLVLFWPPSRLELSNGRTQSGAGLGRVAPLIQSESRTERQRWRLTNHIARPQGCGPLVPPPFGLGSAVGGGGNLSRVAAGRC